MTENQADPDWLGAFERGLRAPEPLRGLRDVVAELLAAGADRTRVQEQLEAFRLRLQEQNRENDEDTVLDVLDFVTGWCSPDQKL
ncbi:MAG TPA: hypothetical protein VGR06_03440 [Actinophytocola sp.]|uniref:hypothetical protein n=1 Tax=Actinophytocola sp. TaxID=1872138 RepID=UPI002E06D2DD|nr:hypothetical protein [Actinophytocola sp.]